MKLTSEQAQEIKDQQSQEYKTKRVTAPELEKILYEALPILDHGFIRVVDYMGCLLYTSPSPRDLSTSRMPSSA